MKYFFETSDAFDIIKYGLDHGLKSSEYANANGRLEIFAIFMFFIFIHIMFLAVALVLIAPPRALLRDRVEPEAEAPTRDEPRPAA